MNKAICLTILISFLTLGKAYARDEDDLEPLYWAIVAGLVLGTIHAVYVLTESRDELSEDRARSRLLLEYSFRNSARHYGAGLFLDDSKVVHGRYSQSDRLDHEMNFRSLELGYRHYLKILYGELNLFHADYQMPERYAYSPGGGDS